MAEPNRTKGKSNLSSKPEGRLSAVFSGKRWREERVAITWTLVFIMVMTVLVIYTDEVLYKIGIDLSGKRRNPVVDCRKENNKNTPYCLDRKASSDSTWHSITRFGDSPNAFTLHGR